MRSTRAPIVAAALAATLLTSCATSPAEEGSTELRIGMDAGHFGALGTPNLAVYMAYSYFGPRAVYETLLEVDSETSEYVPLLAETFELADDRRHMTIVLRSDVDFTDGEHLDAAAVSDYFDLLFESETIPNTYGLSIEVTGEYELELTTTETMGDGFFEDTLSGLAIASAASVVDGQGPLAGSGPYVITEVSAGISADFTRNPDYRAPERFEFDTLHYAVFADEIAAVNALKADQLDAAVLGGSLMLGELERQGFGVSTSGGSYRTLVITDFTGDIVPALGDERVRRAISMALDQDGMVEALELGYARASDQVFGPLQAGYIPGGDDRYPFDVEEARNLMREAGYEDGFAIEIPTGTASFIPRDFEPVIVQSLAEIGIEVTFVAMADGAAVFEAWTSGRYPIQLTNLGYTQTVRLYQGESPALGGHFDDDATFHRLTETLDSGSVDEYEAAAAELGEYLLDQAWFVPLTHCSVFRVVHSPALSVEMSGDSFFFALDDFRRAG